MSGIVITKSSSDGPVVADVDDKRQGVASLLDDNPWVFALANPAKGRQPTV